MTTSQSTLSARHDIETSLAECRQLLLNARNSAGHWEGELSTSALSTATAVMALHQVFTHNSPVAEREQLPPWIQAGLRWLRTHRNPDAGWGDTTLSLSNISTTMLVRSVLAATAGKYGEASTFDADFLTETDAYISRIGGVEAVRRRYGTDRTFSVPILLQCALGGLVEWKQVEQLPYELACLPANWYKWAQLPVVSYALPALIAIGLARHRRRPTRFLHWRWLRNMVTPSALKVLQRIQPTTGGFLEATPLTSFVTMSLVAAGEYNHPVIHEATRFLVASVRPDGSWPIDTNLATWVTTLSVNALDEELPEEAVDPILDWLLKQQYQTVHPYTNADPGGWAWTDLPGGVPDADDTPGAILALLKLRQRTSASNQTRIDDAARRAVHWLLSLQNRDGGWPTFCRGWGKLPFDRSSQDITAHALRAINQVLAISPQVAPFTARCRQALARGYAYLLRQQRANGAWVPLWFGNQHALEDENPVYGTARCLLAFPPEEATQPDAPPRQGIRFLESVQNDDGGWGGDRGCVSSVEETGLALEALVHMKGDPSRIARGARWLSQQVKSGAVTTAAPIGFYFAKLWYFEKLYPLIFATAALLQIRNCHSEQ